MTAAATIRIGTCSWTERSLVESGEFRLDLYQRLNVISGTVPNMLRLPRGCRFAARCPSAMPICREIEPQLKRVDSTDVSCWLYDSSSIVNPSKETPDGSV